ncbi:MAG: hypothetical protein CMC93_05660 [Flavobacteriaceae bacterium]|nr:hypothetical protein [Flavobacteriaceae bacterium]|tara:strand:+ start:3323 stop:3697 length:375 start_codon:yes stop_codon:yes gene_type:complete
MENFTFDKILTEKEFREEMKQYETNEFYTKVIGYPQKEIKEAVKLMEEAAELWKSYDNDSSRKPDYMLGNYKATRAGWVIHLWATQHRSSNSLDAMREVLELYAPKEDQWGFSHSWNGIGEWKH